MTTVMMHLYRKLSSYYFYFVFILIINSLMLFDSRLVEGIVSLSKTLHLVHFHFARLSSSTLLKCEYLFRFGLLIEALTYHQYDVPSVRIRESTLHIHRHLHSDCPSPRFSASPPTTS